MYDALDDRNPQAVKAKTGGLTQALTCALVPASLPDRTDIAGGSGGAVGTAVLTLNGGRSIRSQLPVVLGPPGFGPYDEIIAKNATGLPIRCEDRRFGSRSLAQRGRRLRHLHGLRPDRSEPEARPARGRLLGHRREQGHPRGHYAGARDHDRRDRTGRVPELQECVDAQAVVSDPAAKVGTVSFPLFNKPSVTLYELNAWEVRPR